MVVLSWSKDAANNGGYSSIINNTNNTILASYVGSVGCVRFLLLAWRMVDVVSPRSDQKILLHQFRSEMRCRCFVRMN